MRNPLTDPKPGDAWMPRDRKRSGCEVLQVKDGMICVRRVRPDGIPLIWAFHELPMDEWRRGVAEHRAVCVSMEGEPV